MQKPAIYIDTNQRNGTLYIGVTSNLSYRIAQHKAGIHDAYSRQHNCITVVYYEVFETMDQAIQREQELKATSRRDQVALIENTNPEWADLYMKLLMSEKRAASL